MADLLAPTLVLVPILTIAAVLFIRERRRVFGPNAPAVVVDRRSFQHARRRYATAVAANDPAWAYAAAMSACVWLKQQVRTGPRRHRLRYASALEQWELRAQQARLACRQAGEV